MAGIIEYAIEQRMIKEALNAMSRKGYRQLDLAHRMIGHAEREVGESGAGARAQVNAQRRLNDLRTDYLHPTKDSVRGDMKGSKMLYKPFHQGGVDPRLAGRGRRWHALVSKGTKEVNDDFNLNVGKAPMQALARFQSGARNIKRQSRKMDSTKTNHYLYAPPIDLPTSKAPSASIAARGDLFNKGWASSRPGGMVTLRKDHGLNSLRQQLRKGSVALSRSAARK